MSRHGRKKAERHGQRAEQLACWFLRAKGYGLRARQFRTPVGEIDLVMARAKTLVFVEVKYRKTGAITQDVSPMQADRLVRAAALYLARHRLPASHETRFDLVLLGPWRWPRHIKGVIMADHQQTGSII